MIIEGAEPFFMLGDERKRGKGVLLVHGFTGMTPELLLLGEALHEAGYTVLAVRLAGHGTSPEDMERTKAADWFDSVVDGYFILKGCCTEVSVIGHSMGGLLALHLASMYEVHALVTLASPIYIADHYDLTHLPSRADCIGIFYPKLRRRKVTTEVWDKAYRKMPLLAVHELVDFIEMVKEELARIHAPILIVHGTEDHTAKKESADYIYEHIASTVKSIAYVSSGHLVMLDREKEKVFALCVDFLDGL